MDRISLLREAHPWLEEEDARFILLSRYLTFTRDLNLSGDTLTQAMEKCVLIYRRLPEEDMRELLNRIQTKHPNYHNK